jgi:type VI protein secretion system component Hcp
MNMNTRLLAAGLLSCAAFCTSTVAEAAIFVKIPNIGGGVLGPDGERDWFVADSFSFGVEREMKESGEKGGTEDINIGVGELQECTISKSMDVASGKLAQFAANGSSPGNADICFAHEFEAREGAPICYLRYKLQRAFVKSWSTSGDADDRPTEEVAFYFNKIAFGYQATTDDGATTTGEMSWDNVRQKDWSQGLRDIFDYVDSTPPE